MRKEVQELKINICERKEESSREGREVSNERENGGKWVVIHVELTIITPFHSNLRVSEISINGILGKEKVIPKGVSFLKIVIDNR